MNMKTDNTDDHLSIFFCSIPYQMTDEVLPKFPSTIPWNSMFTYPGIAALFEPAKQQLSKVVI